MTSKSLTIILILVSFLLGLLLGTNVPQDIRQPMTTEYNRGFVEGRFQAFGEAYECEGLRDENTQDNYFMMKAIVRAQGLETYIACEE